MFGMKDLGDTMTFAVGDRIPAVPVKIAGPETSEDVDAAAYLGDGLVVMFTVPGAFTPTCHMNHLPGFVADADLFEEAGVSKLVCASVNDHHVMRAWGHETGAFPAISMLADGNGDLAAALGLQQDRTEGGMGVRFQRTALIISDGVVKNLLFETGSAPHLTTGAPALLDTIKSLNAHETVGAE